MLRNVYLSKLGPFHGCYFCALSSRNFTSLANHYKISRNRDVRSSTSVLADSGVKYKVKFAREQSVPILGYQPSVLIVLTRDLHLTSVLSADSKVEQQLEIIKDKKKELEKQTKEQLLGREPEPGNEAVQVADAKTQIVVVLPLHKRIWQKTKKELIHYYTGFKLFFLELGISLKLLRKVMNGDHLTRRERKQLSRTVADIFRLVPFLIFIIIPFMEFFLPVAIKLFPGMLPSTFEEKSANENMAKQRFKLKLEMARFLQDTVEQMAVQNKAGTSDTAQKFADFMSNVQKGDIAVSNEEIIKFSKAFRDSLMMDNLERQQLVAICKILNIRAIGSDSILRFQIKLRMRKIRADDLLIKQEGNIGSLDVSDLQNLVRERGMRAYGVSKERLVSQLEEWIELHLNDKVPLSLLLLSRTLYIPRTEKKTSATAEQLKATISALPSQASERAKMNLEELESGKIDNVARLQKVRSEQMAIAAEAAEKQKELQEAEIMAAKAKEREEEKIRDVALHDFPPGYESVREMPAVNIEAANQALAQPNIMRVVEEALTDLAEAKSNVSEERDDLNDLIQDIQDYNSFLNETLEASDNKVKVRRGSKLLSRYLQNSLKRMQPTLKAIEQERKDARHQIEQLAAEKEEALDEQTVSLIESKIENHSGTVASIDEVKAAIHALTQVPDNKLIEEISKVIDPDQDGVVELDTVIKAFEFLSQHSGEQLTSEALKDLIVVLSKEIRLKEQIAAASYSETHEAPPSKEAAAGSK